MARTPTRTLPTATSTPHKGGLSKGGIVGAAVGGGLGFLLIVLATVAFCVMHRRKRGRAQRPIEPPMQHIQPPSELPERNSTYKSHASGGMSCRSKQLSSERTFTNSVCEDSAIGHGSVSPGLKQVTPDGANHNLHPSSPPLIPPPLFNAPSYEQGQQQYAGQQHPAHEAPRPHFPPPQSVNDLSPGSPHSQSHQSYSTYPTSISNTPANLYGHPHDRSYAAHEASRNRNLPADFAGSVELSASPHSQESSYSAASAGSYGYANTDIKAPRPLQGAFGQSPNTHQYQHGPGGPPVYSGELAGRAVSYELPTIRSPERPREMGVNSRMAGARNVSGEADENREQDNYQHPEKR